MNQTLTVVKFTFICNVSGNSYERAIAVLPGMEKEELLKEIEKSVDFIYPIVDEINIQYKQAEADALASREEAAKVALRLTPCVDENEVAPLKVQIVEDEPQA